MSGGFPVIRPATDKQEIESELVKCETMNAFPNTALSLFTFGFYLEREQLSLCSSERACL